MDILVWMRLYQIPRICMSSFGCVFNTRFYGSWRKSKWKFSPGTSSCSGTPIWQRPWRRTASSRRGAWWSSWQLTCRLAVVESGSARRTPGDFKYGWILKAEPPPWVTTALSYLKYYRIELLELLQHWITSHYYIVTFQRCYSDLLLHHYFKIILWLYVHKLPTLIFWLSSLRILELRLSHVCIIPSFF